MIDENVKSFKRNSRLNYTELDKNISLKTPGGILYNKNSTISIATADQPESYETLAVVASGVTGYDQHRINAVLGRNALYLRVINDGDDTLYAIVTSNAESWSVDENVIFPGEMKIFYDIYELRIRSPTADLEYRITEYDYWLSYVNIINGIKVATTPTIYNVTMTALNTEYSQIIPENTKIISFRCQDSGFAIRYSFETGKVATPTVPYRNLLAGEERTIEGLNLTSKILYFACSTAAKVMEIECWS